jgi:hypothetical protein
MTDNTAPQWIIDRHIAKEALGTALIDLNDMVRKTIAESNDTTMHPDLNRQALRDMLALSDQLVKENCEFGHDG